MIKILALDMSKMDFKNARDPEQIRRMKALNEAGICYFCRKGDIEKITTPKVSYENKYWYITPNNFPYEGSVHHYVIVPKRHIETLAQVSANEAAEFFKNTIPWLVKKLKVKGYSLFVRSGDMKYTGATIDHLHFQFLVGIKKPKDFKLKDAVPVVLAFKKRR